MLHQSLLAGEGARKRFTRSCRRRWLPQPRPLAGVTLIDGEWARRRRRRLTVRVISDMSW
jgi:hypothetical protein